MLKAINEKSLHFIRKTAIYAPSANCDDNFDEFPSDFKRVKIPGVKLLGSVISADPTFIELAIDEKLADRHRL